MAETSAVAISCAVEGPMDEAVVRVLVQRAGAALGQVYGKNGKPHLKQSILGYNRAAYLSRWLVLVDLDRDADCAPQLRDLWLPTPAPHMCFRIAVREVEAWLMADRERLAQFMGVAIARIPLLPETVDDPKLLMVNLARHSRRRDIREDMVPRPKSGRVIGPAYTSRLIEFAEKHWRPDVASQWADSLRRCIERIRAFPAVSSQAVL